MNAMLLPVVLGFLLILERRALPDEFRSQGLGKWVLWVLAVGVTAHRCLRRHRRGGVIVGGAPGRGSLRLGAYHDHTAEVTRTSF